MVPNERMTWTGGFFPIFKGVRTFELRPCGDGSTDFVMSERFSGLMLPLVKGSLPDFRPVFERYPNDLKHEAELGQPMPRQSEARAEEGAPRPQAASGKRGLS